MDNENDDDDDDGQLNSTLLPDPTSLYSHNATHNSIHSTTHCSNLACGLTSWSCIYLTHRKEVLVVTCWAVGSVFDDIDLFTSK